MTLVSGKGVAGSPDPNVTVEDSCAGATVQATIVPAYGAWAGPLSGTQWDSVNSGYSGCNEAFATTFTLPAGATAATITVSDLADLMEEFRPLIVDQVVIAAARRAELRPEHGRREETIHGVLLTKAGKEVLVAGYERRMLQHTRGTLPGLSGSLRRHLYRQAERLAACIHDPDLTWTGLSWR